MLKDYFNFIVPSALAKQLDETKSKNKRNELVQEIKKRWSSLKNKVKKMFEDEKEIEQPDSILKIKGILEFKDNSREKD